MWWDLTQSDGGACRSKAEHLDTLGLVWMRRTKSSQRRQRSRTISGDNDKCVSLTSSFEMAAYSLYRWTVQCPTTDSVFRMFPETPSTTQGLAKAYIDPSWSVPLLLWSLYPICLKHTSSYGEGCFIVCGRRCILEITIFSVMLTVTVGILLSCVSDGVESLQVMKADVLIHCRTLGD